MRGKSVENAKVPQCTYDVNIKDRKQEVKFKKEESTQGQHGQLELITTQHGEVVKNEQEIICSQL